MESIEADLKELIRARSRIVGVITRHSNAVKKCLSSKQPLSRSVIEDYVTKLSIAKEKFDSCHDDIIATCETLEVDTKTHVDLQRNVNGQVSELLQIIEQCQKEEDKTVEGSTKEQAGIKPCPPKGTIGQLSPGTLSTITSIKDTLCSIGVVESPTSVRTRFEEQERRFKQQTQKLEDTIGQLSRKLEALESRGLPSSRAVSTPESEKTRRVTFELSGIPSVPVPDRPVQDEVYPADGVYRSRHDDHRDRWEENRRHLRGDSEWRGDVDYRVRPDDNWRCPREETFLSGDSRRSRVRDKDTWSPRHRTSYHSSDRRYPREEFPADSKSYEEYRDYRDNGGVTREYIEQSYIAQQSMIASLRAPKLQIKTFEGDPLQYTSFINSFEDTVERYLESDREKLSALVSYCKGPAEAAIVGFLHQAPGQGYRNARRRLSRKFGSPLLVSQAWLDKLLSYPPLKSGDLLETFSSDLTCCRDSLAALGYLEELKCTNTMRIIISKLPFHLRNRWRKIHRQKGDSRDFDALNELIDMIQESADESCDPAYSELAMSRLKNTYDKNLSGKGRFSAIESRAPPSGRHGVHFAEQEWSESLSDHDSPLSEDEEAIFHASTARAACAACGGTQHFTSRCRRFKELNPGERLAFVKNKRLCLLCLADSHQAVNCPLPWKCQEKSCGKRHHTALHHAFVSAPVNPATAVPRNDSQAVNCVSVPERSPNSVAGEESVSELVDSSVYLSVSSPSLPLTPVTLRNGNKTIMTYALLDSGSTTTLCHARLMEALTLTSIGETTVKLNTILSSGRVVGQMVNFEIQGRTDSQFHPVFGATTVAHLPITLDHLAQAKDLVEWTHLRDINVETVCTESVDLLVGQDNHHLLEPLGKIKGDDRYQPYAVLTPVGWTVYGNVRRSTREHTSCFVSHDRVTEAQRGALVDMLEFEEPSYPVPDKGRGDLPDLLAPRDGCYNVSTDSRVVDRESVSVGDSEGGAITPDFMQQLADFWKAEEVPEPSQYTPDQQKVLDLWENTWRLEDGHITLPIPFREYPPGLANNYQQAKRVLIAQGKRLMKDPPKLKQYQVAMLANIEGKHMELVDENTEVNEELIFYLLHHGVDHPRKPGVTRPVMNGSATYLGISINSVTYPGPDMMNSLLQVTTRFRERRKAAGGDVDLMFNQVKVVVEHRDALRVLFWKDGDPTKEILTYRMTTHIFGTGWAPAAAHFALKKTISLAPQGVSEKAKKSVDERFYVDDWMDSDDRSEDLSRTINDVRTIVACGSFNIGKFCSNDREVLSGIEPERRARTLASIDLDKDRLPSNCMLGLWWDPEEDNLSCQARGAQRPFTRRGLMSSVASVFDPLGLVAPFVVPAKLMLREVCVVGTGWDDPLPPEILPQWTRWLEDMGRVATFRVDRWLGCDALTRHILHIFADASGRSYGAASYLAVFEPEGVCRKSSLVLAKSKLAPTKVLQIPRLEMCAAVLAVRVAEESLKMLSVRIEAVWFWSDSTIVLFHIFGESASLQTFMGNRVSFIQQKTKPQQWRHVPSALNPADLVSRGVKLDTLLDSSLWREGPPFIRQDSSCWPEMRVAKREEVDPREFRKRKEVYATAEDCVRSRDLVLYNKQCRDKNLKKSTLQRFLSYSNDLGKQKRIVCILVRWLRLQHGVKPVTPWELPVTVPEMENAEQVLIRLNQELYLDDKTRNSKQWGKLNVVHIQGIMRVGGRVENAPLEFSVKHPAVIPADSPLAKQIVLEAHENALHGRVDRTLYEIHGRFWILDGRSVVQRILKACITCKRWDGKPPEQLMGDLPVERLDFGAAPFSNTGVDLFGPLQVVVHRRQEKRYGVVYTCMTTRCLHIEVALDLSTVSFLDTLERFIARRGKPGHMRSDNGTNLVGARKCIADCEKTLASRTVAQRMTARGIVWELNTPGGSHQGGAWERMIRTIRRLLLIVLKGEVVSPDRLTTALCSIEYAINSRPLTRLYDQPGSLEVLSPNHLLTWRKPTALTYREFTGPNLRKLWEEVQEVSDVFWARWLKEYLPYLQRRSQWTKIEENITEGELVLILHENISRAQWPVGVVEKTHPGSDGLIRNVTVRTNEGYYRRPIRKIVRLEADCG